MRQRGTSWQGDVLVNGKRHRKSFETEHEALAWEARVKERVAKGLPLEDTLKSSEVHTLRSVADAVESRYWTGTANASNATANADAVVDILGATTPITAVDSSAVDTVVSTLRLKGNSNGTINRKLASLSKILRYAQSRGLVDRVPRIELLKEAQGRLRWYTYEEETRILRAADDLSPPFGHLLRFLADTGCRFGEAMRVTGKDITETTVTFWETKNGKPRTIPLTSRLQDALRFAIGHSEVVYGGWTTQKSSSLWKAVKANAGVTDDEALIHTWRHTCASRLVQAGVPIQVVQVWLGHKSLAMTLRYAHLAPINLVSAASVLSTLVTLNVRCDSGSETIRPTEDTESVSQVCQV
jgi:integrase